MRLRDLRIGTRIWLVTTIFLAGLFLMGIFGYPRLIRLQESFHELKEEIEERNLIIDLEISLSRSVMPVNDYLIVGGDPQERANFVKITKEVDVAFKQLQPHSLNDPQEKEAFLAAQQHYEEAKQIGLLVFAIPQEQAYGSLGAGQLMEKVDALVDKALLEIIKFRDFSNKEIKEKEIEFSGFLRELVIFNVLVILLLAVSALIFGYSFVASITVPIKSLLMATHRIIQGDLDARAKEVSKDEIGQLGVSFNKMAQSLNVSRKALLDWSKTLEVRVQGRTRDLEQAYKKLQELQDSLVQAEKFNVVGRLASGVAHEIKNPLGVIRQSAEYLEGKLNPAENNASEALKMIQDNVKRADDIICALLDSSRASKLEKRPEDINSVLESSLLLIQHSPLLGNIKIVREFGKDLPVVYLDRAKMEQVLINILFNAIQAMPKGGNIFLRTYQSRLNELHSELFREERFLPGEEVLMVEIEDTGAGISDEDLNKVFDPFFTTKSPGQGTGLGLSVSKNILALHKGFIQIQSQKGQGTKVIITLKLAEGGKGE